MTKELTYTAIASLLTMVAGCSSDEMPRTEEFLFSPQYISDNIPATGIEHDVWVNSLTTHLGGYNMNTSVSRSGSVNVTPYVEDNDTLMYIVQYDEGWELYSASKSTDMLICSSPKGKFDINDPNMPESLKILINETCKGIKDLIKGDTVEKSPLWKNFVTAKPSKIKARINGNQQTVSESDLPPGHWILVETEMITNINQKSPKLIKTLWHQETPWNSYTKYQNNNGILELCRTGCAPIAVAQYMYFTHFKEGIPQNSVTYAIQNGLDFSFGGNSSSIWNEMATNDNQKNGTSQAALLIGWVGHEMKTDYNLSSSSTVYENDLLSYLNSKYPTSFYNASIDFDYIKSSIDKGFPILSSAQSTKSSGGIPLSRTAGHLFIIDQYRYINREYKYTYGYKRDPWTGEGADPWEDDEVDEDGNIVAYSITKEDYSSYTSKEIYMNWGWGEGYNEISYNPNVAEWIAGKYNWNHSHVIYKRSNID